MIFQKCFQDFTRYWQESNRTGLDDSLERTLSERLTPSLLVNIDFLKFIISSGFGGFGGKRQGLGIGLQTFITLHLRCHTIFSDAYNLEVLIDHMFSIATCESVCKTVHESFPGLGLESSY